MTQERTAEKCDAKRDREGRGASICLRASKDVVLYGVDEICSLC